MDASMMDVLLQAEKELPTLLESEEEWNTLDINYHPPRVERLWRPFGEGCRVMLHCIHACSTTEALFHPHSWPSAMRILHGEYQMIVGSTVGAKEPPVVLRSTVRATPATEYRYAMDHPDGWHAVIPTDGSVFTIMVTGKPWTRLIPEVTQRAQHTLPELSPKRAEELRKTFRLLLAGVLV